MYTGGHGEPNTPPQQDLYGISMEDRDQVVDTIGEINGVFDKYGEDLKFDRRLMKRVITYVSAFVNKNEDSINFFGDALIGVYPVKFTPEDKGIWFDDVLDLDDLSIRKELRSLEVINPSWNVSSDVTNHSYGWVAHKFLSSPHLNERDRREAAITVITMMQYKFLTSLMAHDFRYPADISVARATYQSLSKKFSLKVHGSWSALIRARSESIVSEDGIHYNTLQRYRSDLDIIRMINDIQGRMRELLKAIVDVFYRVRDSDARVVSTSATIDLEGVKHVMDKSVGWNRNLRYIHEVVHSRRDFVKEQLVDVISKAIHTVSLKHLEDALEFLSDNYGERKMDHLASFLDKTIVYSFNYLKSNDIPFNDLPQVLMKLRSIFMSSRGNDPLLVEIKELGDKLIDDSVRSKNAAALASARTATMLYVVLRTMTEQHFK